MKYYRGHRKSRNFCHSHESGNLVLVEMPAFAGTTEADCYTFLTIFYINCQYYLSVLAGRVVIFFFLTVFLAGCSRPDIYNRSVPLLGTIINIKILNSSRPGVISSEAIERMVVLEKSLSRFDPSSAISAINNRQTNVSFPVSNDIYQLLKISIYLNALTEGAFDITVGPLMKVWGFYSDNKGVSPNQSQILSALDHVGIDKVNVDDKNKTLKIDNPEVEIDFSAVAKGYIVDKAAEVLKARGIRSAIIDAGGDVLCIGSNNGKRWVVGIRDPMHRLGVLAKLYVQDRAVATSGGYENFVLLEHKQIPHIIDPRTGYPPNHSVLSATVIAGSLALADGLATSFFILEPTRSIKICESLDDVDCIIVANEDGNIKFYISNDIREDIEIL